jgi:hypothetical protein
MFTLEVLTAVCLHNVIYNHHAAPTQRNAAPTTIMFHRGSHARCKTNTNTNIPKYILSNLYALVSCQLQQQFYVHV